MMNRIIKKNNNLAIYLLIIILINLYLLTLPLTNVFGYEFSAVNALLLSFLSGLYIISFLKSTAGEKKQINNSNLIARFAPILFSPFAISLIKSIILGFCSFWDGLSFYLVITSPAIIIGGALGSVIFFGVRKFRVLSFIVLYVFILFISVLEIYYNPQIYLYNPLFGYFPGTIYDEGLSVDLRLILYRIFNLIYFLPILFLLLKWKNQSTPKFIIRFFFTAIITIATIFCFFLSPWLGFTTTGSGLKSHLSSYVESKHFLIHADSRIEKKDLQLIVLNQEYYYLQLSDFFAEEPDTKISSYIFFENKQKKDLFGSANADVSKPWLNSIYISYDSWEGTLKHEIAHCFTAAFGSGVFKLAAGFNPALIEGVAEAADGFYDENGIHYLASLAHKNDYRLDLNSLFGSFSFFSSASSLSYIYSGSLIKYLITEYGIEKVKEYYGTNDFEKSFETKFITVAQNYEEFLDTLNSEATKESANYYFGRKPLISKVCPRFISSRLGKAWEYYSLKEDEKANDIFEEILSKSKNYSAVVGLSKIYEDRDSIDTAISLLRNSINTYSGTSSEYDLKFRLAELYAKNSEPEKAKELYQFLSNTKPSRRIELLANTRISLLMNGAIKSYVKGSDYDKYTILRELNSKYYDYSSIPLMIDLSISLEEDYRLFLLNFKDNLEVKDELSSYTAFKISEYMLKNSDYFNARKMASLALRYKGNSNLVCLVNEHYKKIEWFIKNAERVLSETKYELN
jgi:hypothetical protein